MPWLHIVISIWNQNNCSAQLKTKWKRRAVFLLWSACYPRDWDRSFWSLEFRFLGSCQANGDLTHWIIWCHNRQVKQSIVFFSSSSSKDGLHHDVDALFSYVTVLCDLTMTVFVLLLYKPEQWNKMTEPIRWANISLFEPLSSHLKLIWISSPVHTYEGGIGLLTTCLETLTSFVFSGL